MTLQVVTIEVLSHLICGTIMYFVARVRMSGYAWWWGAIGLLTGPLGLLVFGAILGWQVMFQKGAEKRTLSRSEKMLKSQREDQLIFREAQQDPDRDWQLDQLIYEGKRTEALESARERLRAAHEMGDGATEEKLRRYIEKLSDGE